MGGNGTATGVFFLYDEIKSLMYLIVNIKTDSTGISFNFYFGISIF